MFLINNLYQSKQANNKQTTSKQQANKQTTSKQANNKQTTSKQQANNKQTTSKQQANNKQRCQCHQCQLPVLLSVIMVCQKLKYIKKLRWNVKYILNG